MSTEIKGTYDVEKKINRLKAYHLANQLALNSIISRTIAVVALSLIYTLPMIDNIIVKYVIASIFIIFTLITITEMVIIEFLIKTLDKQVSVIMEEESILAMEEESILAMNEKVDWGYKLVDWGYKLVKIAAITRSILFGLSLILIIILIALFFITI